MKNPAKYVNNLLQNQELAELLIIKYSRLNDYYNASTFGQILRNIDGCTS